jgi:hypothetical protein
MTELNALKVVDMRDDVIVEGNPTKEIALSNGEDYSPEREKLLSTYFF